jgi:hypothetical protein
MVRSVRGDDLDGLVLWVRRGGFPGEMRDRDEQVARALLGSVTGTRAVIVALGGQSFRWVDAAGQDVAHLKAEAAGTDAAPPGGFRMGTGDGATLAGVPQSWRLLRFSCPEGDTTVLLPRYPDAPVLCPQHGVPLEHVEPPP